MLRLAFDFIITWRETRTRPNAYDLFITIILCLCFSFTFGMANEKLNGLENTIELL